MTYIYSDPDIESMDDNEWFMRAYETILDWDNRDLDEVDREFERTFNVKLIYGMTNPANSSTIKPIRAIEFPSEGEATLFFLRWR